ncbi:putative ribonuclease H-like domain-containing protein [Tanacetum coccineum]
MGCCLTSWFAKKQTENQLNKKVKGIRCDNGTEFKNAKLIELCGEKGIKRDYSNPRTPQQNGVAERKNRTLIEAARTMLADSKLPTMFWTEAVPQIGHLKPFGCQVTILNTSAIWGKFEEGKAVEVILELVNEWKLSYMQVLPQAMQQQRILSQAEAEIRNQGVYADRDPAGIDSAGGVSARIILLLGDPAACTSVSGLHSCNADESYTSSASISLGLKVGCTGHRQGWALIMMSRMDVKSAFLYGEIEEEVYVTQPKGFEDPYFPKHVYRVVKALYGLHQAPRAWYARLSAFLLQHNYRRGTIDKTLFIKKDSRDILLVQVYVDDIIFGSTNKAWCDEFEVLMKGEFEMSAMGEMTFFLGLQVKQLPDGIFISQDKYVKDMLTKFDMESVRTATTPYEAAKTKLKDETDPPVNVHLYRSMIGSLMYLTASRPDIMFAVSACSRHQVTPLTSHLNAVKKIFKYLKGQPKLGLWYPKDSPFQLEAYSDSDYAGSHGDRKSTTGGCQFLGRRLISWQCKKQTIVATSSTEAEYVAAASCCAQVLWIQNQLLDYGFNFMNTKIFIDNQSTICIVKNPVFHQRTKHIEIRHHFIRDANEKNLIQVLKIHTNDNVADLLTKAFDGPRFEYLVVHIGMVVNTAARCTFFLLTGLVSAGRTMVLLVVILSAGRLVSAGRTMVLLVVILSAGRLVSAGRTMVLLVAIFSAGRLVSAGRTMILLVVILPAGCFVSAGSYGLCCWFRVHAGGHTSAGGFISADRVYVPAVCMVSAVA